MWPKIGYIIFLLCTLQTIQGGYQLKILGLFPHPGISHFHFFHPIMRGLADAGHHVTVVSHFPDKEPSVHYRDFPLTSKVTFQNSVDLKMIENRTIFQHFIEFFMLHEWGNEACNLTLRSNAMTQILKEEIKFDVILMEMFNTDCMMGVAHVLSAPVIALSSCALMPWHYERVGIPMIPSYIPTLFLGQSENMNFIQRLNNWFTFHLFNFMYRVYSVPSADKMIQYKFGNNIPSVEHLVKDTAMFFVNQHFSLSGAKPLPPNVVELGGIHIGKAKPLTTEIQRFLDNAEFGAILISWGSMIRSDTICDQKRENLIKAIKRLKQRVIWKWENDTLENKPGNLLVKKWVPQRDILCHPNLKVFVSHAGLMGTSEAAYCGVPVIATPMYGDQFLNAAALENRGMGVILKYEDFKENKIITAVKTVLAKEMFENAKVVANSFKHRPLDALQTAIWWVEYVAKTKGAPLARVPAPRLSLYIYHSLDIYIFIGIIIIIFFKIWMWLLRKFLANMFVTVPLNEKKNQ